jgi:RNA polymerase sigma factor (sigma-70 family)
MAAKQVQSAASLRMQFYFAGFRHISRSLWAGYGDSDLADYLATFQDSSSLSDAEFLNLFKKFKQGDVQARDRIINSYLRLAVSIARTKCGRGLDMTDMVQEGLLGVWTALEKFLPEKKARLITYAPFWVEHAVERAVLDQGLATGQRVPSHQYTLLRLVGKADKEFQEKHDRRATDKELLKLVKSKPPKVTKQLKLKKLVELRHQLNDHRVSLDERTLRGQGIAFVDLLPDSQNDVEALIDAKRQLAKYRQKIADVKEFVRAHRIPRDADIIIASLNLDGQGEVTLQSLGDKNGFTRERARQIKVKGLELLAQELHLSVSEIERLQCIVEELQRIVLSA